MNTKTFKKLPGVLSFQRGSIITDGAFFNKNAGKTPVYVVRHGIAGTQNTASGKENSSNVQVTETAKTDVDASGLIIKFSLRFLPLEKTLFSCAGTDMEDLRLAIDGFCSRAYNSNGLDEVSRRYARNILNGRWVWRNRVLANKLTVTATSHGNAIATSDALSLPLNNFDNYTAEELALGNVLKNMLDGTSNDTINITADLDFGFTGAVEVFPSQNYIDNKPKGFARPLYNLGNPEQAEKVANGYLNNDYRKMGQAALRDQKIGNAIRTIDTWFDEYSTLGTPIAVEPAGASIQYSKFFRTAKKDTSFDYVKNINNIDPSSEDGMFLIAGLVRGGVYSESEKQEKDKKNASNEKDSENNAE